MLQVVSGLDLLTTKGQEGLEEDMKNKIKGIDTVTHVYFFGMEVLSLLNNLLTHSSICYGSRWHERG